jgi:hypothetical protein
VTYVTATAPKGRYERASALKLGRIEANSLESIAILTYKRQ